MRAAVVDWRCLNRHALSVQERARYLRRHAACQVEVPIEHHNQPYSTISKMHRIQPCAAISTNTTRHLISARVAQTLMRTHIVLMVLRERPRLTRIETFYLMRVLMRRRNRPSDTRNNTHAPTTMLTLYAMRTHPSHTHEPHTSHTSTATTSGHIHTRVQPRMHSSRVTAATMITRKAGGAAVASGLPIANTATHP